MTLLSAEEVMQRHGSTMTAGGSWKPCDCGSQSKVAILIPFRDRSSHLSVLLNNLIPFLQYQKRDFTIFVIEQVQLRIHTAVTCDLWCVVNRLTSTLSTCTSMYKLRFQQNCRWRVNFVVVIQMNAFCCCVVGFTCMLKKMCAYFISFFLL